MSTRVQPPAPFGSLQKPPKREKKEPQPLRRTELARPTKPINQVGKVTKQRAADKRAKAKSEPVGHDGKRQCYICLYRFLHPVLEHVIDASARPDLRSNPKNHRWACDDCNINKKLGTLSMEQEIRVQTAIEEVLFEEQVYV